MAGKKVTDTSVRAKAQQMREAQEKAERRTRSIIIAVVTVVVIAVIATVGVIISQQISAKNEAQNANPSDYLGDYASGQPIRYSHLGIGQVDDSLPTVTEYFDYSCHHCANLEVLIGKDLLAGADNGEYNIEFQPVRTVGMEYVNAATSASLIVAQRDPEHWAALHQGLMAYFAAQYKAGNGTVIQDATNSWEQVKTIASQVGVSSDVVSSLPVNVVTDYLTTATDTWSNANFTNRESKGTPEFIKDHTDKLTLSGSDSASIMASLRSGLGLK